MTENALEAILGGMIVLSGRDSVVTEGRLRHCRDPVLRAHLANCVVDRRDEGSEIRRVRKADPSRPIDAVIAMALAVWRAVHPAEIDVWMSFA
jgi:phage terminase large subunit-like protein